MAEKQQQQRSIPFSTHARGVPLFDRGRFFDLPRNVARMLLDLRDISSSLFWFFSCQTWLTLWSTLSTLISVCFFSFYTDGSGKDLGAPLDWVLICSVAVLPSVGFLWAAWLRRERALEELAKARVLMATIFTAHRDWVPPALRPVGHLGAVQEALAVCVDALRAYLLPMRFYSRYYPYFGYRAAMVHIALERTRQMRRISGSMDALGAATLALHGGALAPALVAQLHDRNMQLQLAIQQLSSIKEFRTPQGVRSMCRFFLAFFVPVFFGPYWAYVKNQTNFAFAFFFSIILQFAVTGLVNAAIALEDPFDNQGMDGIFIDEALFDVEQLVGAPLAPEDGELLSPAAAADAAAAAAADAPPGAANPGAGMPPPPLPAQPGAGVAPARSAPAPGSPAKIPAGMVVATDTV